MPTANVSTDPNKCQHPNDWIHPARVDGKRTVCLYCHTMLNLTRTEYASGMPPQEQYTILVDRLDKERWAARQTK